MNLYPIGVVFPDGFAFIKRNGNSVLHLEPKSIDSNLRGNESAFDECRTVYKINKDGTIEKVKSTEGK